MNATTNETARYVYGRKIINGRKSRLPYLVAACYSKDLADVYAKAARLGFVDVVARTSFLPEGSYSRCSGYGG